MKAKVQVKVEVKNILAIGCALILATGLALPRSAAAEIVDRIVAVVNDDVITQMQLDRASAAKGRAVVKGQTEIEARQEILDRMINDRLVDQLMKSTKIEVTEDDLARRTSNVILPQGQVCVPKG